MENMDSTEKLYFDPANGKLCTSRPSNDKAIAVDMNKQGSGGFFGSHLGRHGTENGYITVPLGVSSNRSALDLD